MPIIKDHEKQCEIVGMLTKAYWMEVETVMNYMAGSINPDGIRAEQVKRILKDEADDELGHARKFGQRIKTLYGQVPGSAEFKASQHSLQPPGDTADIVSVIKGVIEAESGAIDFYQQIVDACDDVDLVTQDMLLEILADEQRHLRLFEGFLREYDSEGQPAATSQTRRVREKHPGTESKQPARTEAAPATQPLPASQTR